MLGGIAPILLFYFPIVPEAPTIEGVPLSLPKPSSFGIPFPIYLDDRLTGLFLQGESRNLTIDTTTQISVKPKSEPFISQRGVANVVTVNLTGRQGSIALSSLLAFLDIIFSKIAAQNYRLSYLNGSTVIFGGRLETFNSSVRENTDLLDISLQISRGEKQDTQGTPLINVPTSIPTDLPLSSGVPT